MGGGGGGAQNFFAYRGRCVCIWTWVLKNFFLVYGPPNPWWGSRVPTPGTPSRPPPYGQASAAAACHSTFFLELHMGVLKHAAACRSIHFFAFMCLSALLFSLSDDHALLAMLSERSV